MIPPGTYDERSLLALTATGDEAAFTELFVQHRDRMYSITMRWTNLMLKTGFAPKEDQMIANYYSELGFPELKPDEKRS